MTEYDIIIIGAGAAGLILADELGKDAAFHNKSVLLLEKDAKKTNDRTWCYWEKNSGNLDPLVYKKWDQIRVAGKSLNKKVPILPYSYKMIRGLDFYDHYLSNIAGYSNITFKQEKVISWSEEKNKGVTVQTTNEKYLGRQVFNSKLDFKNFNPEPKYPILQQHFLGWFIETMKPTFDPSYATFMDFTVPQRGNTRFMYVLPFSETSALVEYTLFSSDLLPREEYESAIQDYLNKHYGGVEYTIRDKEKGSIPMSCLDFSQQNTRHMYYIGTAGGWSKPSTGFTFNATRKKTAELIGLLKKEKALRPLQKKNRFWKYDLLLLNILYRHNDKGASIFEALFKRRKPQLILKFLDEETSRIQDFYIILALNPLPFIKSLIRHVWWFLSGKQKYW